MECRFNACQEYWNRQWLLLFKSDTTSHSQGHSIKNSNWQFSLFQKGINIPIRNRKESNIQPMKRLSSVETTNCLKEWCSVEVYWTLKTLLQALRSDHSESTIRRCLILIGWGVKWENSWYQAVRFPCRWFLDAHWLKIRERKTKFLYGLVCWKKNMNVLPFDLIVEKYSVNTL